MGRKGIVCSEADILSLVSAPASIEIDTSVGDKGIDNYHIDVELSAAFVLYLTAKRLLRVSPSRLSLA